MKAAFLSEPRRLTVEDRPVPKPGPGEVLLRILLAGVCGSDHSLYAGKLAGGLPMIPGHEALGVVEALGEGVDNLAVGQRAVIQPNFPCGACPVCDSGHENICPQKVRLGVDVDGVFAEFAVAPAAYVWPVPDELGDRAAALTEPLCVALHGAGVGLPQTGERVLVLGSGVIGLLALQMARLVEARVSALDLAAPRLKIAAELGAERTYGSMEEIEPAHDVFDLIFETSGAPPALDMAIKLAAPGGRIVLLGLPGDKHPIWTTQIVRKELTIMGSMIYRDEFPAALQLLAGGRIETEPLISGEEPLEGLAEVLENFSAPNRVKTLIRIGG